MTGEITLTGRILPIGGLKEKALAARRAGVKTLLVPARNRDAMEDIPETVKNDLEFIFIEDARDALRFALNQP
jgi:ATP-dependent Lon protease